MLSCRAVLIVASFFHSAKDPDTINRPITLFVPQTLTASYWICCPCPWNPHIPLIDPYNPLLYKHVPPFNLCRCIELRMHVSYLGKWIQKSLQTLWVRWGIRHDSRPCMPSYPTCGLVVPNSPTMPWHPHLPFIPRQAPATPHRTCKRISTPINQMRAAPSRWWTMGLCSRLRTSSFSALRMRIGTVVFSHTGMTHGECGRDHAPRWAQC